MGLYSPPDGSKTPKPANLAHKEDPEKPPDENYVKFYPRPSLGLRLWGPLVPASDNRAGLWTLVGIQTAFGLFCVRRFRKPGTTLLKRDISEFPSLNRFSTTKGELYMPNLGTTQFPNSTQFSKVSSKWAIFQSPKFTALKKTLYLLGGTLLLSQSLLEICRLTILKYDPWFEEARSVREKQFFNDIVKFYHEGIDPARFRVKDAANGNVLPLNTPEVKQSVAFARATAQADSWLISWFGPLSYKPMTFTEYLDRLEYHLEMTNLMRSGQSREGVSQMLGRPISHSESEHEDLEKKNTETRQRICALMNSIPKHSIPITSGPRQSSLKGLLFGPDVHSPDDIDLADTWSAFNPWLDLALETSLSIKFLPTVLMAEESQNQESPDQGPRDTTDDLDPRGR